MIRHRLLRLAILAPPALAAVALGDLAIDGFSISGGPALLSSAAGLTLEAAIAAPGLPAASGAGLALSGAISCASAPVLEFTLGACSLNASRCELVPPFICLAVSGQWLGPGTSCGGNPCAPQICPGDSDCDGGVDFDDIDLFVAALGGEPTWIAAYTAIHGAAPACSYANNDVDGAGGVDFDDIDPFVAAIGTTCP
jgi:hypothetical protein